MTFSQHMEDISPFYGLPDCCGEATHRLLTDPRRKILFFSLAAFKIISLSYMRSRFIFILFIILGIQWMFYLRFHTCQKNLQNSQSLFLKTWPLSHFLYDLLLTTQQDRYWTFRSVLYASYPVFYYSHLGMGLGCILVRLFKCSFHLPNFASTKSNLLLHVAIEFLLSFIKFPFSKVLFSHLPCHFL